MLKKFLKNTLLSGGGGVAGGLAGFKLYGMEFDGSGLVLLVSLALLCTTFILALLILTWRTDLTTILVSWATRSKPDDLPVVNDSVESG